MLQQIQEINAVANVSFISIEILAGKRICPPWWFEGRDFNGLFTEVEKHQGSVRVGVAPRGQPYGEAVTSWASKDKERVVLWNQWGLQLGEEASSLEKKSQREAKPQAEMWWPSTEEQGSSAPSLFSNPLISSRVSHCPNPSGSWRAGKSRCCSPCGSASREQKSSRKGGEWIWERATGKYPAHLLFGTSLTARVGKCWLGLTAAIPPSPGNHALPFSFGGLLSTLYKVVQPEGSLPTLLQEKAHDLCLARVTVIGPRIVTRPNASQWESELGFLWEPSERGVLFLLGCSAGGIWDLPNSHVLEEAAWEWSH